MRVHCGLGEGTCLYCSGKTRAFCFTTSTCIVGAVTASSIAPRISTRSAPCACRYKKLVLVYITLLPNVLPFLSQTHGHLMPASPSIPRRISRERAHVLNAMQARLLPVAVAVEIANTDQSQAGQNPSERKNVGWRRVRHVHLAPRRRW